MFNVHSRHLLTEGAKTSRNRCEGVCMQSGSKLGTEMANRKYNVCKHDKQVPSDETEKAYRNCALKYIDLIS